MKNPPIKNQALKAPIQYPQKVLVHSMFNEREKSIFRDETDNFN